MNNSDFLSDAVALDLGKSGVKVAETLEIEVGEEWWRLINAAAVTEGKMYSKRTAPQSLVIEGELNLGGLSSAGLQMSQGWNGDLARFYKIHTIYLNEVVYFYAFSYDRAAGGAYLRIWTESEEVAKVVIRMTTYNTSTFRGAYYDAANNRIVSSYTHYIVTYSLATGAISTVYNWTAKSSDFWTMEVFPEFPGAIYSTFLSSAGGAKVKKKIPVIGENAGSQMIDVTSNTSAVAIPAITNFSLSHGLHPFYLRAAESVGLAWVDATSGAIGYVLESENWATARYFPAVPDMLNNSLLGIGCAMLPVDGEFLMVATRGYTTGNVTKSVGYSFPENFNLIGSYPLSQGVSRVFGYVGTTVYTYDLTLDTMTLDYIGVACTSFTYSGMDIVKIAESADGVLDLFAFTWTTNTWKTPPISLGLYNRVTNNFLWFWRDYTNTDVFPHGGSLVVYSGVGAIIGNIFRFDDSLLFTITYNSGGNLESIVISVDTIMSCTSASEVSAALSAAGAVTSNTMVDPYSEEYSWYPGSTGCLTGLLHDDSFLYLVMLHEGALRNPCGHLRFLRLSKSDRTQCTQLHRDTTFFLGNTSSGIRMVAGTLQKRDGTYLYKSGVGEVSQGYDNLIRISGYNATSRMMFWNPTVTPGEIKGVVCSDGSTDYITTILCPCVEEPGEAATYTTYGTEIRAYGAAWDLSNRVGNDIEAWTAPFAPTLAIIDQPSDAAVFFGAISNGELPYIKMSATQGLLSGMYAIKISDSSVYNITLGNICSGGMSTFAPCGSWIAYRSISGMNRMISTGALMADGMGGDIGEGGEANYVYEYLDRQFIPYPFAREGIRAELSNISKTTKITMPETQDNLIRGMLAAGTDFRGSRCILRRVFPDHMDAEGSDIVLLDGYIQDWSYVPGKKGIAFSVSKTLIDVGGQFPKRLMNMGCSHVFKGARCQYLGEEGRCLKTKTFCTSLANQLQFGGFPWIAARQRRVMWK